MNKENTKMNHTQAWLMLLVAGICEVGYALSVYASKAFTILQWSIPAVIFFLLTLYTLSVALKVIDVGIGYAVWAGIGSVGSAIFGSILFDQTLTIMQTVWLVVIISGVVWLKLSDSKKLAIKPIS